MTAGSVISCLLIILVGFQALFAHTEQMLTLQQMMRRGIFRGLPFTWHLGMYGDIIISYIVGYLLTRYALVWFGRGHSIEFYWNILTTLLVVVILHNVWANDSKRVPGAHAIAGKTTVAGWLHDAYMMISLPVILHYYLDTPAEVVKPTEVIVISSLLAVHIFAGIMHPVLNTLQPYFWYKGGWKQKVPWCITVVVWALLAYRTYVMVRR